MTALFHEASRTGSRTAATAVASRAVSGAREGGLPHSAWLRSVSGGRFDPASVSATVVDELPALGVTYGGRVALRRGAPRQIAAHEAAHALGADERTARRVERDPSLLGTLEPKAPVDGWAVGFEFQCQGSDNPSVYAEQLFDPGRGRDPFYKWSAAQSGIIK